MGGGGVARQSNTDLEIVAGARATSGICADTSSEMSTMQQKAQCALWFAEFKSVVTVHHNFRRQNPGQRVRKQRDICHWVKSFSKTGIVQKKKRQSPGWPRTTEEKRMVQQLRISCVRSPKKSIPLRSLELGIPKTSMQNVLHKRLRRARTRGRVRKRRPYRLSPFTGITRACEQHTIRRRGPFRVQCAASRPRITLPSLTHPPPLALFTNCVPLGCDNETDRNTQNKTEQPCGRQEVSQLAISGALNFCSRLQLHRVRTSMEIPPTPARFPIAGERLCFKLSPNTQLLAYRLFTNTLRTGLGVSNRSAPHAELPAIERGGERERETSRLTERSRFSSNYSPSSSSTVLRGLSTSSHLTLIKQAAHGGRSSIVAKQHSGSLVAGDLSTPLQFRFTGFGGKTGPSGVVPKLPFAPGTTRCRMSTSRSVHDGKQRFRKWKKRHDGNTARLARRCDEAPAVRVSFARIAPSHLNLGRAVPYYSKEYLVPFVTRFTQ
ncbi:hypothetical protein PR048_026328 [Dryococelus australis]|uniref:DUF4817 domain-containing protein n=1 Tax=Dryococelus australis TaxID=614101 RepID=A0ABQ9GL21_9NEOP|nr:hypothetical protein PR048_026328 [Dryococelus australis]